MSAQSQNITEVLRWQEGNDIFQEKELRASIKVKKNRKKSINTLVFLLSGLSAF